ncbi:MAG: PqqD family peptide modification chaperone [Rhodospirillaceae bacterium]
MTITLTSTVRKSEGPVEASMDGRTVMLNMASGKYFGLDDIGTDVWSRLEGSVAVMALVDALEALYDAPRATLEADVLEFLRALETEGLVEAVPSA